MLDLTGPAPCVHDRLYGRGSGGGVGSNRRVDHRPPMALRLVSVGPPALRWLDRVVYEIDLENRGTTPLAIPWASQCDVPMEDPNLTTVSVCLAIADNPTREWFGCTAVFGVKTDPRTMRAIAPHEKVRIRLAGIVYGSTKSLYEQLEPGEKARIEIRGRVAFMEDNRYSSLLSTNVASVELIK